MRKPESEVKTNSQTTTDNKHENKEHTDINDFHFKSEERRKARGNPKQSCKKTRGKTYNQLDN